MPVIQGFIGRHEGFNHIGQFKVIASQIRKTGHMQTVRIRAANSLPQFHHQVRPSFSEQMDTASNTTLPLDLAVVEIPVNAASAPGIPIPGKNLPPVSCRNQSTIHKVPAIGDRPIVGKSLTQNPPFPRWRCAKSKMVMHDGMAVLMKNHAGILRTVNTAISKMQGSACRQVEGRVTKRCMGICRYRAGRWRTSYTQRLDVALAHVNIVVDHDRLKFFIVPRILKVLRITLYGGMLTGNSHPRSTQPVVSVVTLFNILKCDGLEQSRQCFVILIIVVCVVAFIGLSGCSQRVIQPHLPLPIYFGRGRIRVSVRVHALIQQLDQLSGIGIQKDFPFFQGVVRPCNRPPDQPRRVAGQDKKFGGG